MAWAQESGCPPRQHFRLSNKSHKWHLLVRSMVLGQVWPGEGSSWPEGLRSGGRPPGTTGQMGLVSAGAAQAQAVGGEAHPRAEAQPSGELAQPRVGCRVLW